MNLARKGFAVFAIDPIGQASGSSTSIRRREVPHRGPTSEHSYAGKQYLIMGRTLAMVRVWDAMRALDYLAERRMWI